MKILALVLVVVLLLLTGCSTKPTLTTKDISDSRVVEVTFRENGISANSIVEVGKFYPGARAEMVYRVHNTTGKAVRPGIYLVRGADVASYSKAEGAVKAPDYALNWVELPNLKDVPPGGIEDFVVAIQMPKGEKKFANRWGFQVGVANTGEGQVQVAVGTWWIVNMR